MANEDDNAVSMISGQTNTAAAAVPVGEGPFEVAANPRTNTVYVANHTIGTVSVISGRTNTAVATIGGLVGTEGARSTPRPTSST